MEFPDWVQVEEKHYRWLTRACHEITLVAHFNGQRFMYYRNNCLSFKPGLLELNCNTEIQKQPALFRNHQNFVDCSMERSIRYNFFD